MTKPDPQRLTILTELRREAGLNLTQMARRCGLHGRQSHQTAGAWEHGVYVPSERRRMQMIGYLWDDLLLRTTPEQFEAVWAILEEEWGWAPISDEEWGSFTTQTRPGKQNEADKRAPYQAPAAPPSFVGRTDEMAALRQLLADPSPHPVALVGMGGIGKSTIAARAASQLRDHFADGVLWANTRVSDPLDILNSWAKAFGHDYSGLSDVQSRASAMRNLLADKKTLIVLDDVSSPSRVRSLLPGHADCAVLLTTRSEDVAMALGSKVIRLSELALGSSLELMKRLFGQARLDAEPGNAETICTLLHNLPLAIEIVGQLLAARPRRRLATMAASLRDAQARLDLSIADRDVRTSFLVSWAALDGAHRKTFAHMAIFEGRSFTAEALAAVLEIDALTVADQVDMLVALSLVSFEEADRYRQHPLLADFACEQLGNTPDAWMRFTAYELAFTHSVDGDLIALEPEWNNVMAGMRTAGEYGALQLVLDYAEALTDPWFTTGRYDSARQGYRLAVESAKAMDDKSALAFALCKWGRACFEQDDYEEAERLHWEAQKTAQIAENYAVRAESSFWIGRIALERGKYNRADRFLRESEGIYRALEEPSGLALVFYQLAQLQYDLGDLGAAETLCQHVMAIQDEGIDQTIQIATLRLLADVDIESGDYGAASEHCNQALDRCQRLGSRAEMAATYYSLAVIDRLQGGLEEANQHASQSLQLCKALGLRAFEALALYEQSRICALQRELDRAYELCANSVFLFRELGRAFNLVYALNHLGQVCYDMEKLDTARKQWTDALTFAEHLEHPLVEEIRERLALIST